MDAATGSIIAAIICAVTSIAVAMITTLTRIAKPSSSHAFPTTPSTSIPAPDRSSFRKFRVAGWILLVIIYLMTAITVSFGVLLLALSPTSAATPPGLFFCAVGVLLATVGIWSQRRLRRASKWYALKVR